MSSGNSNGNDYRNSSGNAGIHTNGIIHGIAKGLFEAGSVKPEEKPGDYYIDGLLYCGKCKAKKQKRLVFEGETRIVRCICQCEVQKREAMQKRLDHEEEMRRIERLKSASLMDSKMRSASLKTFTQTADNEKLHRIIGNYVEHFSTFYEQNRGILFWGDVGTGKSYAAACIANELLSKSVSVVMTSFVKILPQLQGFDVDESEYMAQINVAKLLIIDDLGAERSTDYALEKVYNVIDSRYRTGKPLILTTNLSLKDMQQTQDIRYQRIYDRIFEMCHPVRVTGGSWRIEQARKRFEETSRLLEG